MDQTSASLLEQVRNPADDGAWQRFVQLYTPLLYAWARQLGVQAPDAADLVQDVFVVLVQQLPRFAYDRQQSFRAWLRTVLLNKWRDRCRRGAVLRCDTGEATLTELAGPPERDGPGLEEAEYQQYLVGRALEIMKAEFQPATWRACWESVVAGRAAADVAAELGISLNAVYVAKSRVLRRLRHELDGLLA